MSEPIMEARELAKRLDEMPETGSVGLDLATALIECFVAARELAVAQAKDSYYINEAIPNLTTARAIRARHEGGNAMTRVTGVGVDVIAGDTPIMEARKLAELIWANWHAPDETYRQSENRSAALIQSRDDAIRAEERERCADIVMKWHHDNDPVGWPRGSDSKSLRAAIRHFKEGGT
jgi:hypothetical protein